MKRASVAMAVLVAAACSSDSKPTVRDAGPLRRVPEPSPAAVRAVPPHEIHGEGVGPYLLGAPLRNILARLPHGPRVELLQIEGIADYSLVRTESDKIVIGVQKPMGVTFVSILGSEIAQTDQGLGVGSPVKDLLDKHGALAPQRSHAGDPRIVRTASLPGVRFVTLRDRVLAVVVERAPAPAPEGPASSCQASELAAREDEVRAVARLGDEARIYYGCFGGDGPEALVYQDRRVVVVGKAGDKLRRLAATTAAGLVFASAIEIDGDDRDEIVMATLARTATTEAVTVEVFRLEGSRLVPLASERVYGLEERSASWVGAKLKDLEFLLEVDGRGGVLTVSGLFLHEGFAWAKEVVPLAPVSIAVRRRGESGASPPPPVSDGEGGGAQGTRP